VGLPTVDDGDESHPREAGAPACESGTLRATVTCGYEALFATSLVAWLFTSRPQAHAVRAAASSSCSRTGARCPSHAIAEAFDVSRPMVSKHLRALVAAGVVEAQAAGRERRYRLLRTPAAQTALALSRTDADYARALAQLRDHLGL
jgi:DNA-binding transcriptional ArsR family regulator